MTQVGHLPLENAAFLGFQLQVGTFEAPENFSKVLNVVFEGSAVDYDVIDVDEACLPLQTCQDSFHQSLEGRRGIGQPKWHDLKLEQTTGRAKSRLLLCVLVQSYLPIATGEVKS